MSMPCPLETESLVSGKEKIKITMQVNLRILSYITWVTTVIISILMSAKEKAIVSRTLWIYFTVITVFFSLNKQEDAFVLLQQEHCRVQEEKPMKMTRDTPKILAPRSS
jgi:hypothetical protein